MTRDEAVQRIKLRLAFHPNQDTNILLALQDAQEECERAPELPFFLKTEISSIDTVADEERVPIPTNPAFLRELEEEDCMYLYDSSIDPATWTPLAKMATWEGRANYPGTGTPVAYSLDNDYFRIFPTPDAVYRLKMVYYGAATVLDTNIENEWLKYRPGILIGRAGLDIAASIRDANAVTYFDTLFKTQMSAMMTEEVARKEANRVRAMGGSD